MEEKKYTFLKVLTIIFLIAMIAAFVFVSILYFSTILDMLKYDANDPNNDSTLGIGVGLVFTIILVISISIKCQFLSNPFIGGIAALLLAIFFILVMIHEKIAKKENIAQQYIDIIDSYKQRRNGNWKDFETEELLKNDLATDLDLVGKNSLFQLINISKSINSKKNCVFG